MSARDQLQQAYEELHREGTILAGGLTDLAQRAAVYRHVFRESGRNHIFPLIAAHGALWARGYFRFGMQLGQRLSWQYAFAPACRARQLTALEEFANAFRDINRRVCVDTYANFHFTARFGEQSAAADFVSTDLLGALNRVHAARRLGRELSDAAKRGVFRAHFMNEQRLIVGPSLEAAAAKFDWPLLKFIALRPFIRFAYFGRADWLWFGSFLNRDERIANGLRAFDVAAASGWDVVESALRGYQILPEAFFAHPAEHFATLRRSALAAG